MLRWESQRLDVSVPSVTELTMVYTSSRQILACDVAACRYAFGCLQSSLCGSGTSGALCSVSFLLHIIISSGQTFQTQSAAALYLIYTVHCSVCLCVCACFHRNMYLNTQKCYSYCTCPCMLCMYFYFPLPANTLPTD